MKLNMLVWTFALLALSGGIFALCLGPVCVFDSGGLLYIQQEDAQPAPPPTLEFNITDCVRNVDGNKYADAFFNLDNIPSTWKEVTCQLIVDGKNARFGYTYLFGGAHNFQGAISYRSQDDAFYGCGQHDVYLKCYNARLNLSLATEIIDSQHETFTCTNCCAGAGPVSGLLCTDNCASLTPPQYKKYVCGAQACACQLQDFNVTCSSGKGNANGELCIDDCDREIGYCSQSCTCQAWDRVSCASGRGVNDSSTQLCIDDCDAESQFCGAGCTCQPRQEISCASGIGIANASAQLCIDDCAAKVGAGRVCEQDCTCWPSINMTLNGAGCTPLGGSVIRSDFDFSVSPPPLAGEKYDCKVIIDGVPYAYATLLAGQANKVATTNLKVPQGAQWSVECTYNGRKYVSSGSQTYSCTVNCAVGVGNASGYLCADDCKSSLGAGYTCQSNCTCKKDDVQQVNCSAGTGNASGQLCIDDCAQKLGANYSCNSACKCEITPPDEVLCSSGIGNLTGQLCIDDCTDGFVCNSACKCEKLPPATVSCASGVGNQSGQLCLNDCKAGQFCNNECVCEPLPTTVYCSQGSIAPGLACIDDCKGALGADFYCDAASCTCKPKDDGSIISSAPATYSTWTR